MEKEKQKAEVEARLAQMDQMQLEMEAMRQSIAAAEDVHSQVQQMFDEGILKAGINGKYQAVLDPNESEHIRSTNAQASKMRQTNMEDINLLNQQLDGMNE